MLEAGGVAAVLDGSVVRLPDADYLIADACSGLRFLLVSLAAALLAAHLLLRSWRRRLLLLATAVLLPLGANALRSALLIWLAARGVLNVPSAAMHLTYGLGLTAILLAALMLLAWLLRERTQRMKLAPVGFAKPGSPVVILASAGTVALLALMPATILGHEPPARPVELAQPQVRGEWREEPADADLLDRAALAAADGRLVAAWRNQSARVELLLHYYARERQGAEAAGEEPLSSGWADVGAVPVRLTLEGQAIEAQARRLSRAGERRVSCTLFWVGGRFTGSAAEAKLIQIGLRLTGRAAPTARLELVVAAPDELDALKAFLANLQPVDALLQSAGAAAP
jgi:EpsI family protein